MAGLFIASGSRRRIERGLEWDGGEKFYNYVEWLQVLIDKFFKPWDIKLSGTVRYKGEDGDSGYVMAANNKVITKNGIL